jgi:hypothetical protein
MILDASINRHLITFYLEEKDSSATHKLQESQFSIL